MAKTTAITHKQKYFPPAHSCTTYARLQTHLVNIQFERHEKPKKKYGKWNNGNYMIFYFGFFSGVAVAAYFHFVVFFIIHMCDVAHASVRYFSLSIYG